MRRALPRVIARRARVPLYGPTSLVTAAARHPRLTAVIGAGAGFSALLVLQEAPVRCDAAPSVIAPQIVPSETALALHAPLATASRVLRSLLRLLYLGLVFSPLALTWHLSVWTGCTDLWWRWLAHSLESSGALLIKLAQWSSSRPDLFGDAVCARFLHLQSSAQPHPWRHTVRTLDAMFAGREWRDELRLDSTPIGSGCIAQVYRGELRNDAGEWQPVAVKVIHPQVARQVAIDMDVLHAAGYLLERLPRLTWLNPSGMLGEFASLLLMQLDLRVEADHLDTFLANFSLDGRYDGVVTFPRPCWPYVSRDVLVESFIEGEPFVEWARTHDPPTSLRQRVCEGGVDAVLKMIFVDNFVHTCTHT